MKYRKSNIKMMMGMFNEMKKSIKINDPLHITGKVAILIFVIGVSANHNYPFIPPMP
jgi:hypothetical protein